MAIVIGAGIKIGGGIGVGTGAPVTQGPTPDTFTVATVNDSSYDYYGAYNYPAGGAHTSLGISDFGVITSDYFYSIYLYTDGFSTYDYSIFLKEGSYSGFTVFNGVIDNDPPNYPRVFTIGGTNYTFFLSTSGTYLLLPGSDTLSLMSSVGSTIAAVYNPAIQLTIPSGYMYVASWLQGAGSTYYGANTGTAGGGYLNVDHIYSIDYTSNYPSTYTTIKLIPGTYTGFVVDSDGAIDSSSTSKVFTIDGTNGTFNRLGSAPNYVYVNTSTDVFGLTTKVGQIITAAYDPAQNTGGGGGGATAFATGTMTVGTNGFGEYGWSSFQYGSSSFSPPGDPVIQIKFDPGYYPSGQTRIGFISGTYGSVVVDSGTNTVDGESTITVTIDGVSAELTFNGSLDAYVLEDPFGLQAKNGQTLNVSMVAGIVVPPSNEVASGDITVGTDPFSPGSIYGYWPGPGVGSSTISPAMVAQLYWYSGGGPSGTTSIRITAGTYGSVVVDGSSGTVDGETQLTVVVDSISQTGTLTASGSYVGFTISGDPYSLQSKNTQTLAVSIIAGAGGGGGTTYSRTGNWSSPSYWNDQGDAYYFRFSLSPSPDAGLLAALNALAPGDTINFTAPTGTPSSGSFTVVSISGQPYTGGSFVDINTGFPNPSTYPSPSYDIESITI